jgi:hypothetical protein
MFAFMASMDTQCQRIVQFVTAVEAAKVVMKSRSRINCKEVKVGGRCWKFICEQNASQSHFKIRVEEFPEVRVEGTDSADVFDALLQKLRELATVAKYKPAPNLEGFSASWIWNK